MLYERWREVAKEWAGEIALRDLGLGQSWTFGQLAHETEAVDSGEAIAFPRGADFIFSVLKAWRGGQITCPLEAGQERPALGELPAGCAHIKTTSASTGAARMVLFGEEQLVADAGNIVTTMGLLPDRPNLGVISLAHSYGFSNLVLPLLLHGIPLILCHSPLPESVRKAAALAKEIALPAVPALWRAWFEAGAIPDNVRLAISAGAPLTLALERQVFERYGLKLHNFYGSTECGGIAYDATEIPRDDASLAGTELNGVSVSLGHTGCLEITGKAVGLTYWPEPQPALLNGVFRGSDLGELSGNRVFLKGRVGDQINVAGRKVSPEVIELQLLRHPLVRDCLVFGAPSSDAERTDMVVAYVVGDAQLDQESLKQYLLNELPAWQIPRAWVFVRSLEVNQRGKISRLEWREKFLKA